MNTTHTVDTLSILITSQLEPCNAETVLAALRPLNGQLITTRLLDKLPGGRVEWRLRREMGNTALRNRAYLQTKGDSLDALDLTLAHSEASVPLDVAWVERENHWYFADRRDRNEKIKKACTDVALLTKLAFVMNEIVDLNAKLAIAKTTFVGFVDRGGPLEPVRYELERACGMREEKKR